MCRLLSEQSEEVSSVFAFTCRQYKKSCRSAIDVKRHNELKTYSRSRNDRIEGKLIRIKMILSLSAFSVYLEN